MANRYLPKTLAKTISYIAYHAPEENGLFWDPDGTMPWKELYWALQEDPSLRFVRESHLQELSYLGIELPFSLEDNLLRLNEESPLPLYPIADVPERLFYACRRKQYAVVSRHGIHPPANRSYAPLSSNEDLAFRIGQRRDPEPIIVQVEARRASQAGIVFREVGSQLYLVETLPCEYLIFPLLREEDFFHYGSRKRKEEKAPKPKSPPSPGSFTLDLHYFTEPQQEKSSKNKGKKKGKKGPDWKRDARKERQKRYS